MANVYPKKSDLKAIHALFTSNLLAFPFFISTEQVEHKWMHSLGFLTVTDDIAVSSIEQASNEKGK